MVVYPEIPGLSVEVKIDNETAAEYPADNIEHEEGEDDDIPTVSKFIEARTGADFYIEANMTTEVRSQIELPASPACLRFNIHVDGIRMVECPVMELEVANFMFLDEMRPSPERQTDGSLQERNFSFIEVDSVESSDVDRVGHDKQTARALGCIEILVDSGTMGSPWEEGSPGSKEEFKQGGLAVAEKAMKGREVTHGTTLRNTGRAARLGNYCDFTMHQNICRFRFYYRSRLALQKLMVIERTPEPSDLDTMTLEQLRELAEEAWRARQSGGVKRENDDKDHARRSATLIKTEHVDLTEEAKWDFPQEPVDLTEDE